MTKLINTFNERFDLASARKLNAYMRKMPMSAAMTREQYETWQAAIALICDGEG
jgi:hypothetical protein